MSIKPHDLDGYTVEKNGTMPVTVYVDSWSWRCWKCGWLGLNHHSVTSAENEALRHITDHCEERNPVES